MTANADAVVVAFRDSVAAVAPRPAVAAGACSTVHVWANVGGVGADFVGIPGATGTLAAEKRPQVAGVFTDLKVAAQPGLSARIDVDTRFITSPTPLKLAVMVLGVICVTGVDRGIGGAGPTGAAQAATFSPELRRRIQFAWRRFWRVSVSTWLLDIGVIGTLLLWHLIGAISSDDGYNLTIARVSGDAGYTANYFRFFGATEAPFDWYQSVLAHMAVDQHGRRVDAAARHRGGHRDLADHQSLRAGRGSGRAAWRTTGSRHGPQERCSWPRGCRSTTACGRSR